jgi:hypothetical protein
MNRKFLYVFRCRLKFQNTPAAFARQMFGSRNIETGWHAEGMEKLPHYLFLRNNAQLLPLGD